MATPHIPSRHIAGVPAWHTAELADGVLATYADWKEREDAVAEAYGQWSAASPDEEELRFCAYLAALDQEETAAAVYAQSLRALSRRTHCQ